MKKAVKVQVKATAKKAPVAAPAVKSKKDKVVQLKGKNQQMTFVCSVRTTDPVQVLHGTITEVSDVALTISHKKHRSKKMLQSVIPLSQILLYANPNVEGEGRVSIRRGQVQFQEVSGVEVTSEGRFLKVVGADGSVTFIDDASVDVVAEDEEATNELSAKRKAGKAAPKTKEKAKVVAIKKSKVQEEEEEEEEDEDEEEDEEDDILDSADEDEDEDDDFEEEDEDDDD